MERPERMIRVAVSGAGVLQIARLLLWACVLFVTRSSYVSGSFLACCAWIAYPMDGEQRTGMFVDDVDRAADIRTAVGR